MPGKSPNLFSTHSHVFFLQEVRFEFEIAPPSGKNFQYNYYFCLPPVSNAPATWASSQRRLATRAVMWTSARTTLASADVVDAAIHLEVTSALATPGLHPLLVATVLMSMNVLIHLCVRYVVCAPDGSKFCVLVSSCFCVCQKYPICLLSQCSSS